MKLVHFTAPDGNQVGVNPDQVVAFHDAESGAYAPGAKTVIHLTAGFQAVREGRAEFERRLAS